MGVTRIGRTVTAAPSCWRFRPAHSRSRPDPAAGRQDPDYHVVGRSPDALSPGARPGREAEGHRRPPVLRAGGRQGQHASRSAIVGLANTSGTTKEFIDAATRAAALAGQVSEGERHMVLGLEAAMKGNPAGVLSHYTELVQPVPERRTGPHAARRPPTSAARTTRPRSSTSSGRPPSTPRSRLRTISLAMPIASWRSSPRRRTRSRSTRS